jgi:hypothetical protein
VSKVEYVQGIEENIHCSEIQYVYNLVGYRNILYMNESSLPWRVVYMSSWELMFSIRSFDLMESL